MSLGFNAVPPTAILDLDLKEIKKDFKEAFQKILKLDETLDKNDE